MIMENIQGDSHPMPNSVESILAVFLMSLGDVGFIWEGVVNTNHEIIGKINFFIFIAIVVILLLNLLIAMMGDTYAKIAEIKNEWMRQVMSNVMIRSVTFNETFACVVVFDPLF